MNRNQNSTPPGNHSFWLIIYRSLAAGALIVITTLVSIIFHDMRTTSSANTADIAVIKEWKPVVDIRLDNLEKHPNSLSVITDTCVAILPKNMTLSSFYKQQTTTE